MEEQSVDAWFEMDPADLLGADCHGLRQGLRIRWMSGWTRAWCITVCRRHGMRSPAFTDLYLEGSDQHRGWFQSSLLTSTAMNGRAPYRQCMTHGFTVDEKGHKMSKSLGNTIAPQQVANSLGADVLRLWVAATDYSGEMSASDEILKRIADSYRRMRNTARFLLGNLHGFDPVADMVAVEDMVDLDRWAVLRAAGLQKDLLGAYETYAFHRVYQELHNFCVVDMGGFYLDILKDRLYTTGADSHPRKSAQTAMYLISEAMVRWLAPVLSFTAEEIWHELPGERDATVFLSEFYELPADGATRVQWQPLIEMRDVVAKALEDLRDQGEIGSALEAAVTIYADGGLRAALESLGEELRFVFITSEAAVSPLAEAPDHAVEGSGFKVTVGASPNEKCIRCWHRRADVGQIAAHPEICGRCVDNVEGSGEQRQFA